MAGTISGMAPTEYEGSGNQLAELTRLHTDLDRLWERYLGLLDQYQAAQKELQSHLSSGFFNLAQANFKASNGRRYGQDYYDGRMKASRRYCTDGHGVVADSSSGLGGAPGWSGGSVGNVAVHEEGEKGEPKQQPSPPNTPTPESEHTDYEKPDAVPADEQKRTKSDESVPKPPQDPLHWFGILVPRELRATKTCFSSALDGPILEAANAGRELRQIEAEIRRVRKDVRKAEKSAGGG